ncbi:putative ABC-2 type transporter [Colletotrichum sublineola]|uniref:Putative ABC-2 type transporter n=1 Tax=Colletotrichum sublineola TaxID=1173701 RepID=A0A066XRQ7_COLSU|nr:putative ABC-2 type transporter [Colletotrichum sublineola]
MNPKTKPDFDGRWGEDAIGDISVNATLDEYHHLERELDTLQRNYSGSTHQKLDKDHENISGNSDLTITPDLSVEDGGDPFDLPDFLQKGIIDKHTPNGDATKRLGISFKNLSVKGVESSRKKVVTFPLYLLNSFGPDLYNFICGLFPVLAFQRQGSTVDIVRNLTGTVRHGEIMLVLGRPGSGCSTFLKAIANRREEYASVEGEVRYGNIPAKEQLKRFRGEVVYCEEDDRHFPNLTVFQTLLFALMTKTRKREQWTIQPILDSLLQMFGIEHIKKTLVGDEFIRGGSGGERKRVSLAETLASRASVVCWDNSTRGLDSHTAYSFAKSLRAYTDVSKRTTLVTLYQAGRMLFQGPASEAKKYFENLGYLCLPRQTTADFLTSVSDVKSRRFQNGREEMAPKAPEELEKAFRSSEYYNRILKDIEDYERETTSADDRHRVFEATVKDSKSKTVIGDSVYTVSYVKQIIACTKREFWLLRGNMIAFYIKLAIITGNALINPFGYGFEALETNEFFGRQMKCSESQLVPRGPSSDPNFQGCSLPGSAVGSTTVSGPDYLEAAFQYSRTNLWRNFGILSAFTVLFLGIMILSAETGKIQASGVHSLMFAKSNSKLPEEKETKEASDQVTLEGVGDSQSVFTFKNVNHTVPSGDGEMQLLHGVCGYAMPGKMIALMGSSGASKTTLLNTLAQRQNVGTISGEILLNGEDLGRDFQRVTGFCEQMDIHEGSATIREALEFSALLRQDRAISREDKMLYVDKIIHLLELHDLHHAVISSLSLEQRKRVTIGVELAAKPSFLLFLDEPTSGLDSQSAFSIIRFLRKLSDAGLAIVCTIHQPSFDVMEKFDMISAINPGGRTFYFGPIGTNGSVIVDYFSERGFPCPANRNVAEFIIETAATPAIRDGKNVDWNDEWLTSDQHKVIVAEIDNITVEKRQPIVTTTQVTVDNTSLTTETKFAASTADHRLFVDTIMGVIGGFTFFMLGNDIASMQNRMFSAVILILFMPPIVVNSVVPKFFGNLFIWEARELPSRTYGWVAFCTANIVCEIPMSLVGGTIYWLLWYFPVGYPSSASASWGQWIAWLGPPYPIIASIIPFFMVVATFFNGILAPYASIPAVWRYTLYYVNTTTWFSRGVLSEVLAPAVVQCSAAEFARFNPPSGLTCGQYASHFVDEVAKAGYIGNPDATAGCSYCPYRDGVEYMRMMNIHVNDKWPAFGILSALAVIDWILIYLFIYIRVNAWTFGIHKAMRPCTRLFSRRREHGGQSKMEEA